MPKVKSVVFTLKHVPNKKAVLSWKQKFNFKLFSAVSALALAMSLVTNGFMVQAASSNPAANLDQCANGGVGNPPVNPCQWVNGNVNGNQGHYVEGQSMAYRMVITNLSTSGTHNLIIGFDVKQSDKFAIDYITSNNRIAETVNPCDGISPCVAGTSAAIPAPAPTGTAGSITPATVTNSFNSLNAVEKLMRIYNGTINSINYTQQANISLSASEARVTINFTASQPTAVLSWGGHISKSTDYPGISASSLPGSPYHTRLISIDGVGGNQDRALAAGAIILGKLTVIKHVINTGGGIAVASDFTINVTGSSPNPANFFGSESGTNVVLETGPYSVDEASTLGYTKTLGPGCSGTITASTTVTCLITNTFQPTTGTLNVIKHVINNNGGMATSSNFTMTVTGSGPVPASFPGSEGGTAVTLNPGSYSVGESGPSGYTSSLSSDCTGNIAAGQTKTCTLTNDDQAASLTVIKHVINDNGGTASSSDFTINVTGANVSSTSFAGAESPGTTVSLNAGSYSVDESVVVAGYVKSLGTDCSGSIANGQSKTCTITNNDIQPVLTVVKHVDNSLGGSASSSDFNIHVTGGPTTVGDFAGSESGTVLHVNAGTYTVSEDLITNYTASFVNCTLQGVVLLNIGDNKTCTITNTFNPPPPPPPGQLTVIKTVVNDNGGTKTASNFTINVTGTNVSQATFPGNASGTTVTLDAGSYSVGEVSPAGYASSSSISCSGSIASGESKTCTLTNDDIAAKLTVTKIVINDSGTGSSTTSDFTLKVASTTVISGVQNIFDAGSYLISESGSSGYTATFSGDCDAQGNITLGLAEIKSCTITNDDNEPTDADIAVTKVVDLATPSQGDTVIFTMVVMNNGLAAATNVVATDTLPSGLSFVSASTTAGTFNSTTTVWSIGSLAKGDSATLTIVATVNSGTAGQTIVNAVIASANQPDSNSSNNSASASVIVNTPPPPPSGGGGGGGGSTSSGGAGFPTPPAGQVLGTSTPPSLSAPPAVPQVLGTTTHLPRTGLPAGFVAWVLLAAIAILDRKFKLI